MLKFPIAYNIRIVTKPGQKPDFGVGKDYQELTQWQKNCRWQLTHEMISEDLTAQEIAYKVINRGGTITAQHKGGAECAKKLLRDRDGQHVPHMCQRNQHRLNDNFLKAQHLGADFDTLESESEILDDPFVKAFGGIYYHTASSKPEKPKMRVIFLLDTPIENGKLYQDLLEMMVWKFEKADKSCTDICRLFFGCEKTNPVVTENLLPMTEALSWLNEFYTYRESLPKYQPKPTRTYKQNELVSLAEQRRIKSYLDAVIRKAQDNIRKATIGGRHDALKDAAVNLFSFVRGGVLDYNTAKEALEDAYRFHNRMSDFEDLIAWAEENCNYISGIPEPTPTLDFRPYLGSKNIPTKLYKRG